MTSESFKNTYLPFHQKMYRIALRLLNNADDAQDAVQDAFLKLWNKRNELHEVANNEAFAVTILRNICLDFLKKEKMDFVDNYVEISAENSLFAEIEMRDNVHKISELIEKLPEPQRQIILFRHWDGFSDEEIVLATGLTEGNIRVLLSRARKTVRENFLKMEMSGFKK
jgi:RNA polymerase sigma-70 factor (ECF subfamily)